MSIWAVNWALQTCVANPTHKLVLVALANYADDNDWAWPRVDTLAELTSSSRRTVFRALNGLAQTGLIERLEGFEPEWNGSTRRVQSVWRLMIPDSVSRRSSGRRGRLLCADEPMHYVGTKPLVTSTVTLMTQWS